MASSYVQGQSQLVLCLIDFEKLIIIVFLLLNGGRIFEFLIYSLLNFFHLLFLLMKRSRMFWRDLSCLYHWCHGIFLLINLAFLRT